MAGAPATAALSDQSYFRLLGALVLLADEEPALAPAVRRVITPLSPPDPPLVNLQVDVQTALQEIRRMADTIDALKLDEDEIAAGVTRALDMITQLKNELANPGAANDPRVAALLTEADATVAQLRTAFPPATDGGETTPETADTTGTTTA